MAVLGLVILPLVVVAGWMKNYDIGDFSMGLGVIQNHDAEFIVTGMHTPIPDSRAFIFLLKTDAEGDTQWMRSYGLGFNSEGHCVQQTFDGGYIVMGFANGDSAASWPVSDIWLLKTDFKGDTEWTKLYRGNSYAWGCWVEQTPDSGYILTSNWNSTSLLLLKTDKNGNTLWSHNYNWNSQKAEAGYCVHQTKDGGYIVATNMGLFKTDSKGDSVWLKPWVCTSVEQTADNGYILNSGHNSNVWLIKTDDKGDTLWTKTYGGIAEDKSYEVYQTKDGGYAILAETRSFGAGNYDVWLLKTDSIGDTLWTRTYGGEYPDYCRSLQQTTDGGYIMTGIGGFYGGVLLIKTDSLGFVGISEPVPVTHPVTHLEIANPIGKGIVLRYWDCSQGFHAFIYDASGRKVDEIHAQGESGILTWGQGRSTGVYFIKTNSPNISATKVVLIK